MKKIDKLVLKNFKFFYGENVLNFEGNNILLYGENGSGKSSIYWALYTLLQSSIKKTDDEKTRIRKYFAKNDEDTLVNRYTKNDEDSAVAIKLNDGSKYIVSLTSNTNLEDTTIYEAYTVSDFINYKLLAKNFDFKHSENLDMFKFLEKNILDDVFTKDKTTTLGKWWKKLKHRFISKYENNYRTKKDLLFDLELFFEELKDYLASITEDINYISKEYFKLNMNISLEIDIDIVPLTKYIDIVRLDSKNIQTTSYYAKFPNVYLHIEYDESIKEESDKYINRPHTYLNEAKLSAIALSIRFSMLRKKATADDVLKILVLDDLLVSLDMSNRDMMLKMIVEDDFLQDYQIIMLTHDRAFFEMAKNKFNNFQKGAWKYFEMYVDNEGDFEKPHIKKSLNYFESAKKHFEEYDYPACANYLRKEVESLKKKKEAQEVSINEDKKLFKKIKKMLLSEDLMNDEKRGRIIGKLRGFKTAFEDETDAVIEIDLKNIRSITDRILNPQSHDDISKPLYKKELEEAINIIKEIKDNI